MESMYDEDLNDNSFFQTLQNEHRDLFDKATLEGWVICVPRSGALPKYALSHQDFFSHILIPSDELPESHFRTLNDKEVRVCNRVVTIEQDDISRPYSTHILFEETFYTDDLLKYKVLCIESPLERHSDLSLVHGEEGRIVSIQTLRDCIDLLWTESAGKEVLERMDDAIQAFLTNNSNLELETLQTQRDSVGVLYTQCLQIVLRDVRLREKSSTDKHLLSNIKLSVETYVHHGIYKRLMKGISACTAYDDAHLNKIIRNLSDVQLRDLDVRSDLYDTVPYAKQQLARIDCYGTILGKIGCLKKVIGLISKQNTERDKGDISMGNVIAADDLLPMMVFLVIKTSLPNWIAQLTYMKQFRFSTCSTCLVDEYSFLITTLEAAMEHVKSGILLGHSSPEAQHVYEAQNGVVAVVDSKDDTSPTGTSCISHFFDLVRLGNLEAIKETLNKTNSSRKKEGMLVSHLCHPLCSCDKCEGIVTKSLCDTTPTIHSRDDRGFTALHVASLIGQSLAVDLLLTSGANINATDYSGSTPLHYAASKGHQNALLLLLHSGAKIDIADNDGNTPLHLASNNGHEDCVKALLYFAEHVGCRLDTNAHNAHGDTPLHHAARWGYEDIVQILLEYGARPDNENKRHVTPLDCAHNLHVSKMLSEASKKIPVRKSVKENIKKKVKIMTASLDFSDDSTKTAPGVRPQSMEQIRKVEKLLRAIAHGDVRLACFYLGVEGQTSDSKVTRMADHQVASLCHPLCNCEKCSPQGSNKSSRQHARHQKGEVLNVNVSNPDGFTPLHVAAMHGCTEMVRLLLDCGAKPNAVTRTKGATPLHLACQNQRTQIAKLLLESAECDADAQDSRGNTALHYACFSGNSRLVELILKHTNQVDLRNMEGKTALEEAEEKMLLTIVRLLKGGKTLTAFPWEG